MQIKQKEQKKHEQTTYRHGRKDAPVCRRERQALLLLCLGAEYLCEEMGRIKSGERTAPQFRQFVYKVERCEYVRGTEYYYMSRDGRALSSPFGANRLHYVLHFMQVDELAQGTRQELPLTAEEINTYFSARKAQFEACQSEAYRILKSIPRYAALNQEQTRLCIKIGYAEARGTDAAALEAEYRRVTGEIDALYNAAGINPVYLREPERCPKCGGTGLNAAGAPCDCALRIEETIKDYCAALRINRPKAV